MNKLESIRQAYETGNCSKQDYIEQIHERHAQLFDYSGFIADTDVESIRILPEGIAVRSRSQQIELFLDPVDQHLVPYTLMNFHAYEEAETEFLKSVTEPDWTILDIGANCGWYALALARKFPRIEIHAFEPIPNTNRILSRNIDLNGFKNIHTHLLGLSDQEATLEFLYTPGCSGATSLTLAGQPTGPGKPLQSISCTTSTIDIFCRSRNLAPKLIKCDVEGAELMVMRGGEGTIAANKPIILIELLRKWALKFSYHPNDVFSLLGRHGYKAFTLSPDALTPCAEVDESTRETNFVFLHEEQHQHIIAAWKTRN